MKKILKLINDERESRPLLATAMIFGRNCECETDGVGENDCCGIIDQDTCSSGDECYEKGDT